MCKIGDIIVVKKYVGDDGTVIDKQHSFVVINDNPDKVEGIAYDMVANVMSSFKNEEHKKRKLSHKENLEVVSDNIVSNIKNSKSGYIKADQLFYFDKSKLDYYVFASISPELLDELIRLIIELRVEGKLKMNIENIKEKETVNS